MLGIKVICGFEALNTTKAADDMIAAQQRRLSRCSLGLAPPGVSRIKGLEIVDNDEMQKLVKDPTTTKSNKKVCTFCSKSFFLKLSKKFGTQMY